MSRGKILGERYKVGEKIGSGAFGNVYFCVDLASPTFRRTEEQLQQYHRQQTVDDLQSAEANNPSSANHRGVGGANAMHASQRQHGVSTDCMFPSGVYYNSTAADIQKQLSPVIGQHAPTQPSPSSMTTTSDPANHANSNDPHSLNGTNSNETPSPMFHSPSEIDPRVLEALLTTGAVPSDLISELAEEQRQKAFEAYSKAQRLSKLQERNALRIQKKLERFDLHDMHAIDGGESEDADAETAGEDDGCGSSQQRLIIMSPSRLITMSPNSDAFAELPPPQGSQPPPPQGSQPPQPPPPQGSQPPQPPPPQGSQPPPPAAADEHVVNYDEMTFEDDDEDSTRQKQRIEEEGTGGGMPGSNSANTKAGRFSNTPSATLRSPYSDTVVGGDTANDLSASHNPHSFNPHHGRGQHRHHPHHHTVVFNSPSDIPLKPIFVPRVYAVKVLSKSRLRATEGMEAAFEREVDAMKCVSLKNSRHVINIVDVLQSSRNYYLIMDIANMGNLLTVVVKGAAANAAASGGGASGGGGGLTIPTARKYFKQLLIGMKAIHDSDICHRDIKPENLLLDKWRDIKISDFGFAAYSPEGRKLTRCCGTPQYTAPELHADEPSYDGRKVDMWSVGVTLYLLVFGTLPFMDPNRDRLYEKIKAGYYKIPSKLRKPPTPSLLHLLSVLLDVNPNTRWSVDMARRHPWVHGMDELPAVLQKSHVKNIKARYLQMKAAAAHALATSECRADGSGGYGYSFGSHRSATKGGHRHQQHNTIAKQPIETEDSMFGPSSSTATSKPHTSTAAKFSQHAQSAAASSIAASILSGRAEDTPPPEKEGSSTQQNNSTHHHKNKKHTLGASYDEMLHRGGINMSSLNSPLTDESGSEVGHSRRHTTSSGKVAHGKGPHPERNATEALSSSCPESAASDLPPSFTDSNKQKPIGNDSFLLRSDLLALEQFEAETGLDALLAGPEGGDDDFTRGAALEYLMKHAGTSSKSRLSALLGGGNALTADDLEASGTVGRSASCPNLKTAEFIALTAPGDAQLVSPYTPFSDNATAGSTDEAFPAQLGAGNGTVVGSHNNQLIMLMVSYLEEGTILPDKEGRLRLVSAIPANELTALREAFALRQAQQHEQMLQLVQEQQARMHQEARLYESVGLGVGVESPAVDPRGDTPSVNSYSAAFSNGLGHNQLHGHHRSSDSLILSTTTPSNLNAHVFGGGFHVGLDAGSSKAVSPTHFLLQHQLHGQMQTYLSSTMDSSATPAGHSVSAVNNAPLLGQSQRKASPVESDPRHTPNISRQTPSAADGRQSPSTTVKDEQLKEIEERVQTGVFRRIGFIHVRIAIHFMAVFVILFVAGALRVLFDVDISLWPWPQFIRNFIQYVLTPPTSKSRHHHHHNPMSPAMSRSRHKVSTHRSSTANGPYGKTPPSSQKQPPQQSPRKVGGGVAATAYNLLGRNVASILRQRAPAAKANSSNSNSKSPTLTTVAKANAGQDVAANKATDATHSDTAHTAASTDVPCRVLNTPINLLGGEEGAGQGQAATQQENGSKDSNGGLLEFEPFKNTTTAAAATTTSDALDPQRTSNGPNITTVTSNPFGTTAPYYNGNSSFDDSPAAANREYTNSREGLKRRMLVSHAKATNTGMFNAAHIIAPKNATANTAATGGGSSSMNGDGEAQVGGVGSGRAPVVSSQMEEYLEQQVVLVGGSHDAMDDAVPRSPLLPPVVNVEPASTAPTPHIAASHDKPAPPTLLRHSFSTNSFNNHQQAQLSASQQQAQLSASQQQAMNGSMPPTPQTNKTAAFPSAGCPVGSPTTSSTTAHMNPATACQAPTTLLPSLGASPRDSLADHQQQHQPSPFLEAQHFGSPTVKETTPLPATASTVGGALASSVATSGSAHTGGANSFLLKATANGGSALVVNAAPAPGSMADTISNMAALRNVVKLGNHVAGGPGPSSAQLLTDTSFASNNNADGAGRPTLLSPPPQMICTLLTSTSQLPEHLNSAPNYTHSASSQNASTSHRQLAAASTTVMSFGGGSISNVAVAQHNAQQHQQVVAAAGGASISAVLSTVLPSAADDGETVNAHDAAEARQRLKKGLKKVVSTYFGDEAHKGMYSADAGLDDMMMGLDDDEADDHVNAAGCGATVAKGKLSESELAT